MTKEKKEVVAKSENRNGKNGGLSELLNRIDIKEKFRAMLGKKAAGFLSSILSIVHTNSDLKECEPMSVISAAAIAASLDLPINPNLSFAHIVPYGKIAQFQMGWRGFVQLAMRTGQYKTIHAGIVYEGELKSYNHITGEIEFDLAGKKSDNVIGYVAFLRLLNGFEKYLYMTTAEVEAHAMKYSKLFSTKRAGQWKTNFDTMALKTVLKMLLGKYGILSIELERAIVSDQVAVGKDDEVQYIDVPTDVQALTEKKPMAEEPAEITFGA